MSLITTLLKLLGIVLVLSAISLGTYLMAALCLSFAQLL